MAIEHEIVKFVAEMELDAKTTAQFTQGLKDANARISIRRGGCLRRASHR